MAVIRGDVYFLRHRSVTSPEPHYCIVVSPGGDSARRIVIACASSQIKNRKALAVKHGCPPETLVYLGPAQYSEFDRDTVIDCNFAYITDSVSFDADIKQQRAKKMAPFPQSILNAIIRGIHASPRSTEEMKRVLGSAPKHHPPPPNAKPRITVHHSTSQSSPPANTK